MTDGTSAVTSYIWKDVTSVADVPLMALELTAMCFK